MTMETCQWLGLIVIAGALAVCIVFAEMWYRDKKHQRIIEAEAQKRRESQRMDEERCNWRGIDSDLRRRNHELEIENEALRDQIRMAKIVLASANANGAKGVYKRG